jgi:2-keto-4-pentenoate hydratase/2-oxohepta-3-ene-1,7-dioic acid hydratase in catechol pathway
MQVPDIPVVFFKSPNSIQNPFDPISVPQQLLDRGQIDYEAELAVVIGKDCRDVPRERVQDYILGYTCANDVTSRYWQKKTSQWCFSKSVRNMNHLNRDLMRLIFKRAV